MALSVWGNEQQTPLAVQRICATCQQLVCIFCFVYVQGESVFSSLTGPALSQCVLCHHIGPCDLGAPCTGMASRSFATAARISVDCKPVGQMEQLLIGLSQPPNNPEWSSRKQLALMSNVTTNYFWVLHLAHNTTSTLLGVMAVWWLGGLTGMLHVVSRHSWSQPCSLAHVPVKLYGARKMFRTGTCCRFSGVVQMICVFP